MEGQKDDNTEYGNSGIPEMRRITMEQDLYPIENLGLIWDKVVDWTGFGFRDRKRIFGINEFQWEELEKELEQYRPLILRADGLIIGTLQGKQIALIQTTEGIAEDIIDVL